MKIFQLRLGFSMSVLTLSQKLALLLHLHSFIKLEDAFSSQMPLEDYVAPGQLITQARVKNLRLESHVELLSHLYAALQSAGIRQ